MPTNEEWIQRWDQNDTPWNRSSADCLLHQAYASILQRYSNLNAGSVFVPLCGNSRSLRFFYDNGHSVCGVELAKEALDQLRVDDFPELRFDRQTQEEQTVFEAERVCLIEADFFKARVPGKFELIYDRAALVALDPEQRIRYAEKLPEFLAPNGLLYLVTYEYTEGPEAIPPFSVSRSEVERLFSKFSIHECRREEFETTREDMLRYSDVAPMLVAYEITP